MTLPGIRSENENYELEMGKCGKCEKKFNHKHNLRRHVERASCAKNKRQEITGEAKIQDVEKKKKGEAARSSPSEAMLTSAIDQLMTNLGKEKAEPTTGDVKKKQNKEAAEDSETFKDDEKTIGEKDGLLVCGVFSTPTGKISVVQPRNSLRGSVFKQGMPNNTIAQSGLDFKLGMPNRTIAQSGLDLKLGMAKLKYFAPRLFKGDLSHHAMVDLFLGFLSERLHTLPR